MVGNLEEKARVASSVSFGLMSLRTGCFDVEVGAFLAKTEKYNESQDGAPPSLQGWRSEIKDSHTAVLGIPDQKYVSWFSVFDGHAGSRVSAHASHHLLDCISTKDGFKSHIQLEQSLTTNELMEDVKEGINSSYLELNENLRQILELASGEGQSGFTAVCALITEKYLIIANCGVNGKPTLFSVDHKPRNLPVEFKSWSEFLQSRSNVCLFV